MTFTHSSQNPINLCRQMFSKPRYLSERKPYLLFVSTFADMEFIFIIYFSTGQEKNYCFAQKIFSILSYHGSRNYLFLPSTESSFPKKIEHLWLASLLLSIVSIKCLYISQPQVEDLPMGQMNVTANLPSVSHTRLTLFFAVMIPNHKKKQVKSFQFISTTMYVEFNFLCF